MVDANGFRAVVPGSDGRQPAPDVYGGARPPSRCREPNRWRRPRARPATRAALLDRIKTLEQRIADLESGTVLSEPETRVKRIEVYVDKNGNEHDEPVPGAEEAGHLPARTRLPEVVAEREARAGAGR